MYLRTPKRYQKQRRHLISLRWLWLWLLTPLIGLGGYYLYEHRDVYGPPAQQVLYDLASSAEQGISTVTAPTPLPTQNPTERLTVADSAWAQGSIDEAVRIYTETLPAVPNDATVHYRVTLGLLMEGRTDEALTAAEGTITANPFLSDAWAIRASALNAAGRSSEAIASALQALQLDDNNARAMAFLAEAYFDANQPQRALETVERALELNPDSFEAHYVYGRIQQESVFDFGAALEAFDRAYSLAPNMPVIGIEMAWAHYSQQEFDAGFEVLERVIEFNPENTNALYALARFAYAAYGDPNQALDYLTRCLVVDPDNLLCQYYTGTVQLGLGDNQAAKEAFERTIELGTTNPRHYLSAGNINITLGNCAAAIPYLQTGYEMERARSQPVTENLVGFEDGMRSCGVNFTPLFAPEPEATPEATEAADAA